MKARSYYISRNAEIVKDFTRNDLTIDDLCEKYFLKTKQIKYILRAAGLSTVVFPDGPKHPTQILRQLGLTRLGVRGALLRSGMSISELM